jgi:hypothetical protein
MLLQIALALRRHIQKQTSPEDRACLRPQVLTRPCHEAQRSGGWVRRTAERERAVVPAVAKQHHAHTPRIEEKRWLAKRWMCT